MAICKPSHLIGAITGSLGTLTFKITRRGTVVANRRRLTNSKSSAQLASDVRFAALVSAWRALTESQRLSWRTFARNIPKVDRLGITRAWSGFALFISHQTPAYLRGATLRPDPPPNLKLPPPSNISLVFDVSPEYRIKGILSGPQDPVFLIIEADITNRRYFPDPIGSNIPPPTSHFKTWRILQITPFALGILDTDVSSLWIQNYGALRETQWFAVRLRIWSPFALSSPKVLSSSTAQP